jgi:DNA repair protein RecO (recombination protein O)
MKFTDSGIIIGARKYSENALIVKILSENHGLCTGYVRSATSSVKNHLIYQNFNLIEFEYSSKVEGSLGFIKAEITKSFLSHIISSKIKLSALSCTAEIIDHNLVPEDSDNKIFGFLLELLKKTNFEDDVFLKEYIKFEIKLLEALGYGVDLSSCAATGVTTNLYFVSPKSARAVSFEAGEKYRDKLLILPNFLLENEDENYNQSDLLSGLKLSGYFIEKYLSKAEIINDNFNFRGRLINSIKSIKN